MWEQISLPRLFQVVFLSVLLLQRQRRSSYQHHRTKHEFRLGWRQKDLYATLPDLL